MGQIDIKLPKDSVYGSNCGIIATAICTSKPYQEVYKYYLDSHSNPRWTGALSTLEILKGITHFGGTPVNVAGYEGMQFNKVANRISLSNPKNVYAITTTKHIQTVCNGYVIDQQGKFLLGDYHSRGNRVENVFKMMGTGVVEHDKIPDRQHVFKKRPSKKSKVEELITSNPGLGRKDMILILMTKCDMSFAGASTYYYNNRKST